MLTAGQITYDLRRVRAHDLLTPVPDTHRYRVTDTSLHKAMLLTHLMSMQGRDEKLPARLQLRHPFAQVTHFSRSLIRSIT